jgi:hypothetical protein
MAQTPQAARMTGFKPLVIPIGFGVVAASLCLGGGQLLGGRAGLWSVGLFLLFSSGLWLLRIGK